jgi:hypothetical protein
MQCSFKLYEQNNSLQQSTIFDLLSGDDETKQTKCLAYCLSSDQDFLSSFLTHKKIVEALKSNGIRTALNHNNILFAQIVAERFTSDKKRIDILIKLNLKNNTKIAIIIEAKSIKTKAHQELLIEQFEKYIAPGSLPDLKDYIFIGGVLTTNDIVISRKYFNIKWQEIIELSYQFIKCENSITKELYYFLTKIESGMKFYKEEVLTVSASKSYDLIKKHKIYVCPKQSRYEYKPSLFIGFRKKSGGEIDSLYKIEEIIELNPGNSTDMENLNLSNHPNKKRILDYINDSKIESGKYQFYILNEKEIITLKNKPKPKINNTGPWYYTLNQILSFDILPSKNSKNFQ